jgi:hypothetical protein
MIYFIGGAPRTGKSLLGQSVAAKLRIGWISTDLLMELLRVKQDEGVKVEWDASPEAIEANAEWFFPYLERFDQYPGRSPGYSQLPEPFRRRIVHDIPLWSDFVQQEAKRFGYPFVDMAVDFPSRLKEAEAFISAGIE